MPTCGRSSCTAWRAILHAGIVNQPTAYEGNNYLLPTVAAVVLGGTSLLGGRGNLVATAIAALFLSQLDQFVLALGVSYATRTLVQAAALAVGVALYTSTGASSARRLATASPAERRADLTTRLAPRTCEREVTRREGGQEMNRRRGGALLACVALLCSRSARDRDDVVRADALPSRRGVARRRSSLASRTVSAETAGAS